MDERRRHGAAVGVALFLAAPPVVALAQAAPYHPPARRVSPADGFAAVVKPAGPTPRTADGHPDLTGVWTGGFTTSQGRTHIRSIDKQEPDQAAM